MHRLRILEPPLSSSPSLIRERAAAEIQVPKSFQGRRIGRTPAGAREGTARHGLGCRHLEFSSAHRRIESLSTTSHGPRRRERLAGYSDHCTRRRYRARARLRRRPRRPRRVRSLNSLSPLLLAPARTLTNSCNGTNSLSVAQHLGPKRSRLSRLHLQPSSATGLPKSPSLYASPRIPLRSSVSVSASQQGWETLQAGTTPPVSKEPLSIEETAVGAAVLLPRPSRALEEVQR